VNSNATAELDSTLSDNLGAELLSIALIGPNMERRMAVAGALAQSRGAEVREFSSYPARLDDVPKLLEQYYDVVIMDLDSNPEKALELVESICATDSATVMVYSAITDGDLVVRCMRAGAREYLTPPFDQSSVTEALVRVAAALRPKTRPTKRTRGRLLVFLGAKGGSGVTTIACNFAIALAQDSDESTLLIDLGLPLGDAALNLGIVAEFSTDYALRDADRLDASFLHKLLAKHPSGVSVLAAPSKVPEVEVSKAAIDKLMGVAREEFDNVIVDVGSRVDLMGTALFNEAHTIFLVTQAGISELRNSNRLISRFFSEGSPKLEIVVNRFEPRFLGVTEEHITKALNRPVQWKIPDDYDGTREMQSAASSPSLADSPVSRLIREMASSVTGHPIPLEKTKGFHFRGLGRNTSAKNMGNEEALGIAGLTSGPVSRETTANANRPQAKAGVAETIVCAPPARTLLPAEPLIFSAVSASMETSDAPRLADEGRDAPQRGDSDTWKAEPETRTYKGAKYIKGADGQWHLEAKEADEVPEEAPTVKWATPEPIIYGTTLSTAQLNATASVPGRFAYTPGAGYLLPAGTHTLWVTFSPMRAAGDVTVQAAVSITVSKATPIINWPAPSTISDGSALDATSLNAKASVPGVFVYTPAAGDALAPGTHTLSVTFSPTNSTNYNTAEATVPVTVAKATPAIAWPTPEPILYGTELNATQLNAAAPIPGTFAYTPAAGDVLFAGTHTLSVTFTPADAQRYTTAQAAVLVTVAKAAPAIVWTTPEPILYGTALDATQLNAKASIPGTFVYMPGDGAVLAAGEHTPSVVFTPADTSNYTTVQAAVSLRVSKATPAIDWTTPEPMACGTALSATQLSARASVLGSFVYNPGVGAVLADGEHTLSVTFTPADTTNYTPAQADVPLTVTETSPAAITWLAPSAIPYGTALSSLQLNATASVPGTFAYTPSAGMVLAAGEHTLSVTFTPADIDRYATAQATVALVVEGLTNIATLLTAATQTPATQTVHANNTGPANPEREKVTNSNTTDEKSHRETHTYKGATYEKGEDGQWHLQQK